MYPSHIYIYKNQLDSFMKYHNIQQLKLEYNKILHPSTVTETENKKYIENWFTIHNINYNKAECAAIQYNIKTTTNRYY